MRRFLHALAPVLVVWLAPPAHGLDESVAAPRTVAIVGVTILDLSEFGDSGHDLADAAIVFRDGEIVAAGPRTGVPIPSGAEVIELSDKYLLPGLVDGFAGMNSQGQASAYLYKGVTSIVGMSDDRRGELKLDADPSPHVYRLEDVGYPERQGDPPLDDAGALAQLERRAAGGMRVALLMYPNPPQRTAKLARRARELGVATIGELGRTPYADAIAAGVQAFVHTSRYSLPLAPESMRRAVAEAPFGPPKLDYYHFLATLDRADPRVAAWARELGASGVGLIPTLAMEYLNIPGHRNPWLEPVARILDPQGIHLPADRATGEPDRPPVGADAFPRELSDTLLGLERAYHAAGARYLAGSGTSAFGTLPGISLHHELELLVATGSTPREALAAATSNFNTLFGWKEIGCLAPGCRADLLILDANPVDDLANLDRVSQLWLAGKRIDRDSLLRRP